MAHIIIRDVHEDEIDDLIEDLGEHFGLMADVIGSGSLV